MTGVTGGGGINPPSYVTGVTYRAFGAIKGMNHGDTKSLSATYDNRMRPTKWDVSNVLGYNYNYDKLNEHTGRVTYASSIYDPTLDRSYEYDNVGRLVISHSGTEARAHVGTGQWGTMDGPYSQGYDYDVWGNITRKYGWGGEVQGGSPGQNGPDVNRSYTNNRINGFSYDAAGNLTNDLGQTFTYDATGQQSTASYGGYSLVQTYDGNTLRVKKNDNGNVTYYLRSSVLGGQVVAEISAGGALTRKYVYGAGGQLLALKQSNSSYWVHEDAITKSKRVTNSSGTVVSTIEMDPWGADTTRSNNAAFQPRKFTSYERDANGSDEAMFRRSNRWHSRFDQPDPYDGSYHATDPQSLNRYAYVQGDPVNLVDPTGLEAPLTCLIDGMPANCSTAFGLVSSGAGTVAGGPGFYGDVLVVNHEPTFDGGRLYQSLYFLNPQIPDLEGLDLWRAGTDELKKRIKESDPCAEFFGGRDKALKALEKLKPQMGSLPGSTIAAIDGNNVTLDSTRFTGSGTPLSVMRFEKVEGAATYYATKTLNLSGAVFGAFAVGHEFGHKMKSYNKENDKDGGDPTKVGLNSEQLRATCFPELAAP